MLAKYIPTREAGRLSVLGTPVGDVGLMNMLNMTNMWARYYLGNFRSTTLLQFPKKGS